MGEVNGIGNVKVRGSVRLDVWVKKRQMRGRKSGGRYG